tara:strand:+ start:1439 stop:1648 length:210 start_codon:yes stop_codon:yes gene_type:complete
MPGISTVLTVAQVCEALSISEPTLRRYAKSVPQFPRKVKLGPRRVGFIKGEVEAYIASRREAADRPEIR